MNLRKLGRTLWVLAAVAMLAMVLQGCGGDDGVDQSMHDQVMMERDEAQAEAEAAEQARMEAEEQARMEAEAAEQARMEAEAAEQARMEAEEQARMEVEAAEQARMEAEAQLKMEQDADAAQRARVDAAGIQRSAADIITPGVDANGDGDFSDAFDRVAVTVSTTNTVDMYQGSGPVPGSVDGTPAARGANGVMTLTATRVGDTVAFRATADDDTTAAPDADVLINFEATVGDDGMTSGMMEDDLAGGRTRHILLMSDVEAPVLRSFGANVPSGLGAVAFDAASQQYRYPVFGDNGTSASAAANPITVPDNDSVDFTPPAAWTPTNAVPEPSVQDGATAPGSYAGVPGVYRCGGTDCNLGLNDDDELQLVGTWQFVPAGDPVSIADADYLVYGAWLDRPDSAVGTAVSAAISAGSDLFTAANIAGLTGTATYNGSAAGFYAERHVDGDAATSGTFTATAQLGANFGDASAAGTISGSIMDFMRDDEVEVDWLVNLGTVTFATAAAGGFVAGNTSGSASGASWAGEWGVQLVGNGTNAAQHPSGVVGTFGAQHGSPMRLTDEPATGEAVADQGFVGVIGGFGARKE